MRLSLLALQAFVIVFAAAGSACAPRESSPDMAALRAEELIEDRVPRAAAGDPGWAYVQRGMADLDADGAEESVVLISDVTLDASGRPLWEDGHRWQVYVEEPDGARTHAYARFLPNGKLTAEVTKGAEGRLSVVLLEQTPDRIAIYELAYGAPGEVSVASSIERAVAERATLRGSPRP